MKHLLIEEDLRIPDTPEEFLVASAFADLDIRPFRPESVKAYQAAQIKAKQRWRDRHPGVMGALGMVGTWLMGGGVGFAFTELHKGASALASVAVLAAVFVGVLAFSCCAAASRRYEWATVPFGEFRGPVPAEVMRTARGLARRLPNAKLEVEHLTYSTDPFLVVAMSATRHYVKVWDEDDFPRS